MTPSRITKMLARRVMVSWREQPTRYDIEALQANMERVGLVIRVRWALVAALAIFSVFGGWVYTFEFPIAILWKNMAIPAMALVFVLGYNTFYHSTYRQLGNIAILNHAQLMFDAIVVTVLVYYSGGIHSWFWAMYSLFVLEAAFILPKRWHTWLIAAFCIGINGLIVWGEFFGILPHTNMPFISESLHTNLTYVSVRYMWQITVLAGSATVATLMTGAIRSREKALSEMSIVDDKTGLYNRAYFSRALSSEVMRAQRDHRSLAVAVVDVDDFDRFNKLFGIERGDRLLRALSESMTGALRTCVGDTRRDTNIISRYGGEEFAFILAENSSGEPPTAEEALGFMECIRQAAAAVRIGDAGVTVSIGVARVPEDGMTVDDILNAADEALNLAVLSGGNAVRLAESGE